MTTEATSKKSSKSEEKFKKEFDEEIRIVQTIIECTYCRIKPSKVNGVGVFAIRNIASKTSLFPECARYDKQFKVKKELFDSSDDNVKEMVYDFFSHRDGFFYIPYRTLNSLSMGGYINHSDSPNAKFDERGSVCSIKDIEKGDEISIDYKLNTPS